MFSHEAAVSFSAFSATWPKQPNETTVSFSAAASRKQPNETKESNGCGFGGSTGMSTRQKPWHVTHSSGGGESSDDLSDDEPFEDIIARAAMGVRKTRQFHAKQFHCGYTYGTTLLGGCIDLVDPSSELRQSCDIDPNIKKPFGDVSAIHGIDKNPAETGHQGQEGNKAIKFLQEKLSSDMAWTCAETIQTSMYAFQHLFNHKLKATEFQVYVWTEKPINEVIILSRGEIKGHLNVIRTGKD